MEDKESGEIPQRPRALYIEDDGNLGRLLPRFAPGFQFDVATTMPEAEAKLQDDYDAVITDFDFPGGNGFEIAERLKTDGRNIPVGVISGRKFEPDELRERGIVFALQKPFKVEEVLNVFEKLKSEIAVKKK